MSEENKKIKQKKFLDRDWVRWVSFVSSVLSIPGLLVGGLAINNISNNNNAQKNDQKVIINDSPQTDLVGKVAGLADFKSEDKAPKWDDKRGMFYKNDEGYYCIKKKWSYSDQYYFLWNDIPLTSSEKAIIQLSVIKNISKDDSSEKNDSIVIAYADPENQNPLYEVFFPASEKNLIGFDIDGGSNTGNMPPKTIRVPFDVYKDKFEIEYGVNFFAGSNEADFYYNLTYMPDDGYEKQENESGRFTVPMPVNPQNGKPFIMGIGVHRDGPCFKIENFKINQSYESTTTAKNSS